MVKWQTQTKKRCSSPTAGDNRLKICPVWVRIPPALPSFMKTQIKELIDSLEPLFSIQLKTADRFQMDSVTIPVARVRESLKQLRELQKEVQSLKKDKNFMEMMDHKFAHAL